MPYKSVDVACRAMGCEENGRKQNRLIRVESLDALKTDDAIEEICRTCGNNLRVTLSAPSVSTRSRSDEASQDSCSTAEEHPHAILMGCQSEAVLGYICPSNQSLSLDQNAVTREVMLADRNSQNSDNTN